MSQAVMCAANPAQQGHLDADTMQRFSSQHFEHETKDPRSCCRCVSNIPGQQRMSQAVTCAALPAQHCRPAQGWPPGRSLKWLLQPPSHAPGGTCAPPSSAHDKQVLGRAHVTSGPLVSYEQASSAHQAWREELGMLRLTLILLHLLP